MDKTFGVAVKAVIRSNDKFLIISKSNKEDVNPNSFDIPGGRIEFGEQPLDALAREVMEETGLTVSVLRPTRTWSFVKNDSFQLVGVTFLCESSSLEIKLSDEHTEGVWLSAKEINARDDIPSWIKKEIAAAVKDV